MAPGRVRLVHLGDVHLGGVADPAQLDALTREFPALEADALVVGGDLTQRARHGEFLAAGLLIRRLEESCPALVVPGNHDVQWWWRPLVPFGAGAKYRKYRRYFGDDLTPTLRLPGAVVVSVLTAHGIAWGSLTWNLRDIAVKGHLPKSEVLRAQQVFAGAPPGAARVLVVHHNVLRGALSNRMGLARWRRAQRRIVASGAELVLCGHDHQEATGTIAGKVVVSATGTLTTRMRGGRPPTFNVVDLEPDKIRITFHRWEAEMRRFRASDVHVFARHVTHAPVGTEGGAAVGA